MQNNLLEIAGNQLNVQAAHSLKWTVDRDQNGSQLKLLVNYQAEDLYAAIMSEWNGEIWLAYPPNMDPSVSVRVDGTKLPIDDALIIPHRSYVFLNADKTIDVVTTGVVFRLLNGEHLPWSAVEELADDNSDIDTAVGYITGFRTYDELTHLQQTLAVVLQHCGWGNQ